MTAGFSIAPFQFDVTPPPGHSCCGGWIRPVEVVDDALEAIGYVILGAGDPIVVCAVDWLGLANDAHAAWREALAEAARTVPDRVAVQTVHQHNAPLVCFEAARIAARDPSLPPVFDRAFFDACLARGAAAVRAALPQARPVSHVGWGQAPVRQVASNRRVARDAQGRLTAMRRSSCTDPALIALPEGLIDPALRTVAFFDGETKLVSCHYYATHPMSYYEDGRVTSDFCGLARKRRQAEDPGCTHLYFTGCGANLGAGKYNDGTPAARAALTERMYEGIVASEAALRREPAGSLAWRAATFLPELNPALDPAILEQAARTRTGRPYTQLVAAVKLGWIERLSRRAPVPASALLLGNVAILHLPAEVFVEYQLRAQQLARGRFVATAAYGDDGPFYIPTQEEFPHGGYEVGMAFCAESVDAQLTRVIGELLG